MIRTFKTSQRKFKEIPGRKGTKGFSLMEMLVVFLVLVVVLTGGFLVFSTGQATWFTTDINIRLQENLRKSLARLTAELRQTQTNQLQIFYGTGAHNTDILRFSVPVICAAGGFPIDTNGDVAHWGATLRWGCRDLACMDADANCSTVEYKYIEYLVTNDHKLMRRVLDAAGNLVRENEFAQDISDFQASINGRIVTLTVASEQKTVLNRVLSSDISVDIYLRN
jgi:hypothetical protein